jgi:voltage-gated potassium channel
MNFLSEGQAEGGSSLRHVSSAPDSLSADSRHAVRLAGLRTGLIAAGFIALYAVVPVPGKSGAGAVIGLIAGLVAFAFLVAWQVRSITHAGHPLRRGVEVVVFALLLLVVVFAFTYLSLSRSDAASFSEHLDRVDAFYFTVTTVSTVGFGDITAKSDAARIIVSMQMLFDVALLAGLARLVVLATRLGLSHRGGQH